MTVTTRAVRRFDDDERAVYQTAVHLAESHPTGFDAGMLADSLHCSHEEAEGWLHWLRDTGDFYAIEEQRPH